MLKTTNSVINASQITGTLGVPNGGTGLTSLTSGYIPYGNGTSAYGSSSTLTFDGTGLNATYFKFSGSTSSTIANGLYYPATNSLSLATNTFDALYINSSQQVGLGVVPSYKFHVQSSNSGSVVSIARFGVTGNGGSGRGVGIILGAGGSSNSVDVAQIVGYQNASSSTANSAALAFQVSNTSASLTEVCRMFNSGGVSIGNTTDPGAGNLQFSSTSYGIYFGSSSLLSDYETGTFTPTIAFGGANTGVTYTTQTGNYTKIGNVVTVYIEIVLSSKGSSTGNVTIQTLPFTAANNPIAPIDCIVGVSGMPAFVYGALSGTSIYVRYQGAGSYSSITNSNFTNTSDIRFGITYLV